VLKEL
jgi:hypothetical protein